MKTMSMGSGDDQSSDHGVEEWKRENVAEDLCAWFCQLSTQERIKVSPRDVKS